MPASRDASSVPPFTVPVLLRLPDVERMTGIKRSMIYRLEGEGRFPKRVKIGEHASAWVASAR